MIGKEQLWRPFLPGGEACQTRLVFQSRRKFVDLRHSFTIKARATTTVQFSDASIC